MDALMFFYLQFFTCSSEQRRKQETGRVFISTLQVCSDVYRPFAALPPPPLPLCLQRSSEAAMLHIHVRFLVSCVRTVRFLCLVASCLSLNPRAFFTLHILSVSYKIKENLKTKETLCHSGQAFLFTLFALVKVPPALFWSLCLQIFAAEKGTFPAHSSSSLINVVFVMM